MHPVWRVGLAGPLLITCAHAPPAAVRAAPGAPAPAFAHLVDDYFDAKFAFEPSSGTAVGLHRWDRALEDLSRARIDGRIAELASFVGRLQATDPATLSPSERIDARFLTAQARADLFDLQTLETWRRNPMRYARLPGEAVDALMKRSFAPAPERMRSVVARLHAIPALYQAARRNVEDPAPEHVALAARMAKGSIAFFEDAVPIWARAAGADPALLAELEAANAEAVSATRAFAAWLDNDLAPRAHGRFALGADRYREELRLEEMVDTPLPELLALGEAQLGRDRAAFAATAAGLDPRRPPAAVMAALSADHPTAADLVPAVARAVEDARAFVVARGLCTLPSETRPRIQETPPYARAAVFASMDTPGPYETGATEAFYYVTPVEPDWTPAHREEHLRMFNRWTVAMINVHEAYPGHFLQFLYAPLFPTKVRKLLATTANVEGWAHYAEQMMIDEGFGGGDRRLRLAQLQEALLRDCRYVVAIKMHTQGMTVAEATRFFIEQGYQEPANAHEEALRGTYDPMYLAYTLGKLQIQSLRDEYRARGGTLRAFHDAFVAQGGLPIALLRPRLQP
jgi:uncharacterized protein (DUF885 family)